MELEQEFLFTIIVPCKNEDKYILKCLNSIFNQNFPKNMFEVIIVDGKSEDKTVEIVKKFAIDNPQVNLRILENHDGIVPKSLNIGIKNAKGEFIVRMDAHAEYPPDYLELIYLTYMNYPDVDNVGGKLIAKPGGNSIIAVAISKVISCRFGIGNSSFRLDIDGIRYADTVPFGAYKKSIFKKIGFFNENLKRNQDLEFNIRIKRHGGKILLNPKITVYYYGRRTLKDFFIQNFLNGYWVIYGMKFAPMPFSFRHIVPLLALITFVFLLFFSFLYKSCLYLLLMISIIYVSLLIYHSFKLSSGKLRLYFALLISFVTLHFSYGLGSVIGAINLFIHSIGEKLSGALRKNKILKKR